MTDTPDPIAVRDAALRSARGIIRDALQCDLECCVPGSASALRLDTVGEINRLHPEEFATLRPTLDALKQVQAIVGPGTDGPAWLDDAINHLSRTPNPKETA